MTSIVTRESLQMMLSNPNPLYVQRVVGKALSALLTRQTEEEKHENVTKINNSVGFTGADARSGTLTAKYFLKHNNLEDWMVERWLKVGKSGFSRLTKYHKQLNEIAETKLAVTARE
jgi:hypothetical protein